MEIAKKTPGFLTLGSSDEFPGEAWSSVFFGAVLIRYTVRAYSREHHKHIYMATGEVVGNLWKIIVQLHCKTYIYIGSMGLVCLPIYLIKNATKFMDVVSDNLYIRSSHGYPIDIQANTF